MHLNAKCERNLTNVRPQIFYLSFLFIMIVVQATMTIAQMTAASLLFLLLLICSLLLRWRLDIRPEWMLLDFSLLAGFSIFLADTGAPLYLAAIVFYFSFHRRLYYALPAAGLMLVFSESTAVWWALSALVWGSLLMVWELDQKRKLTQIDRMRQQGYQLEQIQQRLLSDYKNAEILTRHEERHKLAEVLHDNLGHDLTAADLSQKAARALLAAGQYDKARQMLSQTDERLQDALHQLKESVRKIEPAQESGLKELKLLIEQAVLPVDFAHAGNLLQIKPYIWQLIIMTVREALTNINKHARPTKIKIDLTATDYIARMTISNDGMLSQSLSSEGSGLRYMRTRIESLNGSLSIQHSHIQFRLVMIIPLEPIDV